MSDNSNLSFIEIQKRFENRSFFVRSQFLEEFDFSHNYKEYFIDFISKNAMHIRHPGYLSDLVCYTLDQNFLDLEIVSIWYEILKKNKSAVVILCILDYFNHCAIEDLPLDYVQTLTELSQIHRRRILINQIYINLISFDESNENYKKLLLNSLKRTKDYRSLLRVLSTLALLNSEELVCEIKNQLKTLNLDFLSEKDRQYFLNNIK